MDSSSAKSEQFYEFESILKKKDSSDGSWYLIKWKGYPTSQSTWQPEAHLNNIRSYVDAFNRCKKKKRKPISKKPKPIPQKPQPIKHEKQDRNAAQYFKKPKVDNSPHINDSKLKKRVVVHEESKQSLAEISKETCQQKTIKQNPSVQYKTIEVTSKHTNKTEASFLLTSDVDQFTMSEQEVKVLFPTELSIFYEAQVRKLLEQHKTKL